jgi:hypothetical protein
MMRRLPPSVVALAAVGLLLAGCQAAPTQSSPASAPAEGADDKPARVTPIQGTDLSRVVLTAQAAERLGIRTAAVQQVPAPGTGAPALSVPLAALLYDRNGATWVYAATAPLTYVRQRVTVARIAGDTVVLQSGPGPGTQVVTVGAAELLGSEYGVEGE